MKFHEVIGLQLLMLGLELLIGFVDGHLIINLLPYLYIYFQIMISIVSCWTLAQHGGLGLEISLFLLIFVYFGSLNIVEIMPLVNFYKILDLYWFF